MIGAYSTVSFGRGMNFGVMTMQDERTALASVAEMRAQVWMISLAVRMFCPYRRVCRYQIFDIPGIEACSRRTKIAAGDFSSRVESKNITEIGTLGETFNVMTDKIEEQIANLAKAAAENRELFVGTVKALAAAIDGKDKYTRGHSETGLANFGRHRETNGHARARTRNAKNERLCFMTSARSRSTTRFSKNPPP